MIKMLYEKNLNAEVTRMIEMNKVKDTPQESFNIKGDIIDESTLDMTKNVSQNYRRVDTDINRFMACAWEIDFNNVEKSNELNHITHTIMTFNEANGYEKIHVFIDTHQHQTYVFKEIKKGNAHQRKGFIIPTYEDTDKYLRNLLRAQLDNQMPASKTSNALRKLWLYQIQNELPEQIQQTEKDNIHISNLIHYLKDYMQSFDELAEAKITYRELFDFFDEVKNQHITEKTQNVQNWVAYSKSKHILQSYEMHENAHHLNQNFDLASRKESDYLKRMIRKDKRFKHHIKNIYKVNEPKPQKQGMSRFTGVHGSPNRTILSILLNGLKSRQSLNKEGLSHSYTGSGLGNGVYFAQLYQASKSANYTHNRGKKRYLIVADVDYDKNNVEYCKGYGHVNTYRYSLVYGVKVGSYNYDEIVAPHDDQINIRYLIEIV